MLSINQNFTIACLFMILSLFTGYVGLHSIDNAWNLKTLYYSYNLNIKDLALDGKTSLNYNEAYLTGFLFIFIAVFLNMFSMVLLLYLIITLKGVRK